MKYVDMTPTWSGILPVYLAVIANNQPSSRVSAEHELQRMAKMADRLVTLTKRVRGNQEAYVLALTKPEYELLKMLLEFHADEEPNEHFPEEVYNSLVEAFKEEGNV